MELVTNLQNLQSKGKKKKDIMTTIRIWNFNMSFIIDRKSIQRISRHI